MQEWSRGWTRRVYGVTVFVLLFAIPATFVIGAFVFIVRELWVDVTKRSELTSHTCRLTSRGCMMKSKSREMPSKGYWLASPNCGVVGGVVLIVPTEVNLSGLVVTK